MIRQSLEERQKKLQETSFALLENLKLLSFLEQFAKPEIVGSAATGLMTWPDIDIELVFSPLIEAPLWKTAEYLLHQRDFKRILIMDFRKSTNPTAPKGLHLCVKDLLFRGETWKIDLWFVLPRKEGEESFHSWLLSRLRPEHRLPILAIKTVIASHPLYRTEIFSIDIYKAVIEENVIDAEDFKAYLRRQGRAL